LNAILESILPPSAKAVVSWVVMQIRPVTPQDLAAIEEIDGTVESPRYLHLEQSTGDDVAAAEGEGEGADVAPAASFAINWRLDERPARQKLILPNRLDDDAAFALKEVVSGRDDGTALLIEIDEEPVAMVLARPDPTAGTIRIVDLRVDYDYRRQGMGTALVYQLIQQARERELRAVMAETLSNNLPAGNLLAKCGFQLSGVDTRRRSNHDVVKEAVTLFWYAALD
jgi:ribosomal protein S18 acetylase RimI-like enzyme